MKGSIEKRGENSWRLRVDLGYNPDGSRNRPAKTITIDDPALLRTTKKLREYLEDQLAEFKREVLSGEYIKPEKMTLKAFVESEWDAKYAGYELSPRTRKNYLDYYRGYIEPEFGHLALSDFKPIHIVNFIAKLRQPGARRDGRGENLSGRTIQYIYSVLRNMLTYAKTCGLIKTNPMQEIPKPKAEKPKAQFYESEEVKQIIDALYSEPAHWRMMILTAILGGLRRGELVALQWSDVDFKTNQIHVERSISLEYKDKIYEKGTKNDEDRYVDMPEWFMKDLKKFRLQWLKQKAEAPTWRGGSKEYIFHAGEGEPFYYCYPSEWWRKFTKRHNIRYISLHKLRHTSVTVLIEKGASLKSIQERVGHKQAQTTNDIYGHVTKKLSREVANLLNDFDPRKPAAK